MMRPYMTDLGMFEFLLPNGNKLFVHVAQEDWGAGSGKTLVRAEIEEVVCTTKMISLKRISP